MSNLQDVPLAKPQNIPSNTDNDTTASDNDTSGSKSNSLKRFFKLGKKTGTSQSIVEEENVVLEDEVNSKDSVKPGTMNRLLTRLKSTSKTDPTEPSTSINPTVEETSGKPVPNAKPTLKASISTYWKQLFHRQKAANRQAVSQGQQGAETNKDVEPSKVESQEKLTDSTETDAVLSATPVTSLESLKMAEVENTLEEEVQVLAISDEIVDKNEV